MTHQNDENQKMALNETGEDKALDTTPVAEQNISGKVDESVAETKPTGKVEVKEKSAETEEGSKKGFSQRVQELNTKTKEAEVRAKEAETKAQSLAEKLGELTGSDEPQPDRGQYQPQVEPGTEVSPDQYKQDVMRTADSLVQIRIKQQDAVNRINNEANDVVREYSQLDPNSKEFDRELSDSVTAAVEAHVKADPYKASVGNLVAKLMKPYNRAVAKQVGKVTENIAKQVSETATRPTSVASSEKKFEELSLKDMEKKLGTVQ